MCRFVYEQVCVSYGDRREMKDLCGWIDIYPILLFKGASDNMDAWDPSFLTGLSSNHTVIAFDQRGIGNTTAGTKPYTYQAGVRKRSDKFHIQSIVRMSVFGMFASP